MTTIVCLSGGLGNQLFQVGAAIYYSDGNDVIVETESNNPELSANGRPVFLNFKFPNSEDIRIATHIPTLIQRFVSLNLRVNLSKPDSPRNYIVQLLSRLIITCYFSIKYRKVFYLVSPGEVGELPELNSRKNLILNGYFQNSHLMDNVSVNSALHSFALRTIDSDTATWITKAAIEKPIVIHFRLGDYANHPGMGILDIEYFAEGIQRSLPKLDIAKVWLFSDEPTKAAKLLRDHGVENLIVVPKFDGPSTLEIMRHGSSFVISNSTFSWWAASLRYDSNANVFAPNPWFKGQESPKSIYMSDWIDLRSWRRNVEFSSNYQESKGVGE